MKMLQTILVLIFIVSCCSVCCADSVVISFSDGKSQTIKLDGLINAITAVHYLPTGSQVSVAPQINTANSPPPRVETPPQQAPSAKPLVKFKWADPIIGQ